MNEYILTPSQARKIILHASGLAKSAQFGKGREAVYKVIRHLGFVQLDTNFVVERAHHHTIYSRVPNYQMDWLNELQLEGKIYEFITSDSGYLPMDDYRFSLPVMDAFLKKYKEIPVAEMNGMQKVLDRIEREGPLMMKDFENDRSEASSGWWDWRPSKIAIERLYRDGRLMVTRDKSFRKIYDLPINIVPPHIDKKIPSSEEYARHVILLSLKSLGIAYVKEMLWRSRFVKDTLIKKELEKMVTEGKVCKAVIEGRKLAPLYMLPAYKNKKIQVAGDLFILSPFDPLNVFRHRLRDFFNFDYQVECFVPEAKRKYGYFSLPILSGERFVARMDAKAERKQHALLIHNIHFEELKLTKQEINSIATAISAFAKFNQCTTVNFSKTNRKEYIRVIKTLL